MAAAYLIAFQPTSAPTGRQSSVRVKVARRHHDHARRGRHLADGSDHDSVREERGRSSCDALDPRTHHREDPRVERPVRRAAVLGRLEPVAGPLARAGVACRPVSRGGLAFHERRQAPVRRQLRCRRACRRPGAAQARPAPPPARRGAARGGAARASRSARAGRRAAGGRGAGAARRGARRRSRAEAGRRGAPCRACRGQGRRRAPPCAPCLRAGRSGPPGARAHTVDRGRDPRGGAGARRGTSRPTSEARVRAAEDQAEAAAHDAYEARRSGRADQARAADAEARAAAAERLGAAARAELASAGTGAAWATAQAAEARAAEAERQARELAALVCGEQRRLSAGRAERAAGRRALGTRGARVGAEGAREGPRHQRPHRPRGRARPAGLGRRPLARPPLRPGSTAPAAVDPGPVRSAWRLAAAAGAGSMSSRSVAPANCGWVRGSLPSGGLVGRERCARDTQLGPRSCPQGSSWDEKGAPGTHNSAHELPGRALRPHRPRAPLPPRPAPGRDRLWGSLCAPRTDHVKSQDVV